MKKLLLPALFLTTINMPPLPQANAQDFTARVQRQIAIVEAEDRKGPFHANWDSLSVYRTPVWFQDAKFGIFIHWGVYSVPAYGSEWYSRNMYVPGNDMYKHHIATYGRQSRFGYKEFIPMFRAEKFDPDAWVDLFAKAGAKYVVPVAEHCDGFPMYNSDFTNWNASKMSPHRDVVGEIATAARSRGLRFGASSHRAEHWWWYGLGRTFDSDVNDPANDGLYGPAARMPLLGAVYDTREPDPDHLEQWLPPNQAFRDDWLARTTEIIDKYHPDFVYLDWWIGQPAFVPDLKRFAAYYYDRNAEQHAGKQEAVLAYKIEAMPANTATLDIERGKMDTLRFLPWQTDTSISIHSWGYVEHDEYRDAKSLIHQLVDTVSKNGNLLLNVGPKADGTIPDEAKTVLLQLGDWLKVNGEAIYGTRPWVVFGEGPTKAGKNSTQMHSDIQTFTAEDIRFTTRIGNLYAIALGWPETGQLRIHMLGSELPYLSGKVCSVAMLGTDSSIAFTQTPEGLLLTLPAQKPNDIAYVFRIGYAARCE